jgi:hypothetical protein
MNKFIYIISYLSLISLSIKAQTNNSFENSFNNYCKCEHVFNNNDSSSREKGGGIVLKTGYEMSIIERTIIKGSCWDFVNEVYNRSGFSNSMKTIFRSKKRGPFASLNMLNPGDWIYHINHNLHNIEHSAIFVCWKDFSKKIAITLSYSGMNRNTPAHFGEYKLDKIYSIFRPKM